MTLSKLEHDLRTGCTGDGPRGQSPHERRNTMNEKLETTNQESDVTADLPEITFGDTEVGRAYLTPAGHQVEVIEVVPKSHAIVLTSKGKEMKILADKACRGPLPREIGAEGAEDITKPDAEPKEAPAKAARAPRMKRDIQVIPLGLLRETTCLLDAAVKASGIKSRSAFIRVALIEKLRAIGGADAKTAATALATEASA